MPRTFLARTRIQRAGRYMMRVYDLAERSGHYYRAKLLALDPSTVADVAFYPYVALVPESDVALDPHPAVCRWLSHTRDLPGYVALSSAE